MVLLDAGLVPLGVEHDDPVLAAGLVPDPLFRRSEPDDPIDLRTHPLSAFVEGHAASPGDVEVKCTRFFLGFGVSIFWK